MLILARETPVGYALLKAKSSKLLKGNHFKPEDDTAENVCSLYVHDACSAPFTAPSIVANRLSSIDSN